MKHEFGPNIDFNIKTTGDMLEYNGRYEDLNDKGKYLLQYLCHAIYQIKEDFSDDIGIKWFKRISLCKIGNSFSVYTQEWMTMLTVLETGRYSYEFKFFSPQQFEKYGNDLLDYAYEHVHLNFPLLLH